MNRTLYYIKDDSSLMEVSKDNSLNLLEFRDDSQEMLLRFAVRATAELKVTYIFKIKYDVIKMENGKVIEIPKELTEFFNFRTLAPFMNYLKWKTNLKEINHVRDGKIAPYIHSLPLNNTSCLNITLSPSYHDTIVKSMKINLNRTPQLLVLKEPTHIQDMVLLSHQLYTTQLIVRATDEIEDFALGNLELEILRKENDQKENKEPIVISFSLENINVRKKPFTVLVDVDSSCTIGNIVNYKATIINNTYNLHKIDFTVLPNEAFYFAGHAKYVFDSLPRSSKEIKLQVIPVDIGKHRAPICMMKCLTLENEVLLDNEETRTIYVYPAKELTLI